jgi:photosystem II stability/assembly factor-like uncharacterized protein
MTDATICIGTINAGMWASRDHGRTWFSPVLEGGRYRGERDVRAIASSPSNPGLVYAAVDGDKGGSVVLRSTDGAETFHQVGDELDADVWTLTVDPFGEQVLLAGTRPANVLRSVDGGASWSVLPVNADQLCRIGPTRLTALTFGHTSGEIWAGVEIGGIFRSTDHGGSWSQLLLSGGETLLGPGEQWLEERHADIHSLAVLADGAIAVATPIGFFRSSDRGRTWTSTRYPDTGAFDASVFYSRSVSVSVHDGAVLVGVGVRPPEHGTKGGINRSTDGGLTWAPVTPLLRSVVWAIATNRFAPEVVAAACLFGQIVISSDGGRAWQVADREFGEIRAIAVTTTP